MKTIHYLLDTNIFIEAIRSNRVWERIKALFDPLMADPRPVYSSVSEGELRSLAVIFRWGPDKMSQMEFLLGYYEAIPIEHPDIMSAYAKIDSETKLVGRRMGKNDLWIAATAMANGLTLLTTDLDFDAISPQFIDRKWIDPNVAGPPVDLN